jgi:hypothetical protein
LYYLTAVNWPSKSNKKGRVIRFVFNFRLLWSIIADIVNKVLAVLRRDFLSGFFSFVLWVLPQAAVWLVADVAGSFI